MTQDQFCDGIRLLGGAAKAAAVMNINARAIERIMAGREDLGAGLAGRLRVAVLNHHEACLHWLDACAPAESADHA